MDNLAAQSGSGITVAPQTPTPNASGPTRRGRTLAVMVGVALIFLVAIIGWIVTTLAGNRQSQKVIESIAPKQLNRIVYAVQEGNTVNVYAANLDGTASQLLLSFDDPTWGGSPLVAKLSPTGTNLAHQFWHRGKATGLNVLDIQSGRVEQVSPTGSTQFDWSPDGTRLVYTPFLPSPPEPYGTGQTLWGPSSWYVYDIRTGQQQVLISSEQQSSSAWPKGKRLGGLRGWVDAQHIFFDDAGEYDRIQILNIDSGRIVRTISGIGQEDKWRHISVSPDGRRRLAVVEPWGYSGRADEQFCDVYELDGNWALGRRLISSTGTSCTGEPGWPMLWWNGNDEMFYTTARAGNGGFINVPSIYRYRFSLGKSELVLASLADQVTSTQAFFLRGVLPGRGIAVARMAPSKPDTLEMRSLDGNNPVTIKQHTEGIQFIGFIP